MAIAEGLKEAVHTFKVSRALTGAMILGSKSPSLPNSHPSSTPGSSNSSRAGTPPSVKEADIERCSCCTVDDFWKIYDSFRLMDKRACGSVRRCDFYEASTEHVTLEMRRTITRGDLHQRFRSSAADMTLAELLERVWPTSTDADRKMMNHWGKLRDASCVLWSSSFKGTRQDVRRIFDLLDVDGSKTLSIGELTRARILTKDEAQKLLEDYERLQTNKQKKDWYKEFNSDSESQREEKKGLDLTFNEFCLMTQKHLALKYARSDDDDNWQGYCLSAFDAARTATAMLNASREGRDLSPSRTPKTPSPEKPKLQQSFKTVGTGITVANALGSRHHDLKDQCSIVMAH